MHKKALTCGSINFGGTLGNAKTVEECIDESSGGYPVKTWLLRSSNGTALRSLKQFIGLSTLGQQFDMKDHMLILR